MVTKSKELKKEKQERVGESVCISDCVCVCVCINDCVCGVSLDFISPTALAFSLGVITGGVVSAALLLALKRGR